MTIRIRLLRGSDGRAISNARVFRYAYTGQSATTDDRGYAEFEDDGQPWSAFNTHLPGGSPVGDRLTTPAANEQECVFVLAEERDRYDHVAYGPRLRVEDTRLEGPDLTVDGLLAGVEFLAELSYVRTDAYESVRVVRQRGLNVMRAMTCLARWGADTPPSAQDPIWFVSPWAHRSQWRAKRDAWLSGLEDYGVYGVLCLFDKTDRPVMGGQTGDGTREQLEAQAQAEGRSWRPENQGTTQGIAQPTTADLIAKAEEFLDGVEPAAHPHLLIQLINEPSANPGQWSHVDFGKLGQEISGWGFTPVSVVNWLGRESDVPGARHLIEDHQWGGGFPKEPDLGRLRTLRTSNDAHVVWSSDGFSITDLQPDRIEEIGRELRANGFSFQGLMRLSPSRWGATEQSAADAIAASMTG